jgi:hypothetical protein
MSTFKHWQSKTAAILALTITTATATPLMVVSSAAAQTRQVQRQQLTDFRIPSGTVIPMTYDKDKIVVSPNETVRLTLKVADDIVTRDGRTILIPEGSEIVGQVEPAGGGSQFVARELITPEGRRATINASSRVVTRTQEVRRGPNARNILIGAAAGSGAAAAISGLTGDRRIAPLEVLAGTGVGAVGGLLLGRNRSSANVVVIEPESDLDLTLRSDLVVRSTGYNTGYDRGEYNPNYDPDDDGGI